MTRFLLLVILILMCSDSPVAKAFLNVIDNVQFVWLVPLRNTDTRLIWFYLLV